MLTICHMFPYVLVSLRSVISLLCPILTHCDPRKSSIFPIFVIFVIYRPRFCPFVHFVIVLYCIYAFWVVSTREINLRSTDSTVGSRANTSLQAEYKFTVVQISNIYTWIRVFVSGFITIRLILSSPLCSFKILPLPLSMKARGAKRNLGRLAYLMQTKKWNPWSIASQTE